MRTVGPMKLGVYEMSFALAVAFMTGEGCDFDLDDHVGDSGRDAASGRGGNAGRGGKGGKGGKGGSGGMDAAPDVTAGTGAMAGGSDAGGDGTAPDAGSGDADAGKDDAAGGTSGSGGSAGMAGSAGRGGTNGTAGVSGTSGTAGTAGSAGTAGTAGSAGSGGAAGTAGTAGTGGAGGIDECLAEAGNNACDRCTCENCFGEGNTCRLDNLCLPILLCSARTNCRGLACLGVCGPEIEAGGGLGNIANPQEPVGKFFLFDQCRAAECVEQCGS